MGEKDFSDRALVGDDSLSFVPRDVFRAVRSGIADPIARAEVLADLCRINTLYMIMQAGSGHIGSSFSSTDLITWLWTEELHDPNGESDDADVYFSSKGHDVPALYSLLIAIEKLGFDLLPKLRQLHGLPGHPDVSTPFIAANTGSLGMGISKAYGMARANRYAGRTGRIVVMTGDGELQEGQIWESLQPVANERLADITVIVDHNKFQSDTAVATDTTFACCATRLRTLRRSPTSRRCSSPIRSRARACPSWKALPAATRRITSMPARRRSTITSRRRVNSSRASTSASRSCSSRPPC